MGSKSGRSSNSSSCYAIPCLCTMLGLIILAFQAGPLSFMWAHHHLQHLAASPLASTLPFSLPSHSTVEDIMRPIRMRAHSPLPSVLKIDASPCICSLRMLDLFNPNTPFSQHDLINCTCPSIASADLPYAIQSISTDSSNTTQMSSAPNFTECELKQKPAMSANESCSPKQRPLIKVEEPWYVKGRSWHPPPRFPRCTMDSCFNYTRCENSEELLIYTYGKPALPVKYFTWINQSKYTTNNPNEACLFFVFLDTPGLYRAPLHPSKLPYWQGGLNHVLITFGDKWLNKGPAPESIGYASAMASVMHQTTYRPGFDVSIPLPAKRQFAKLRDAKPFARKYLMTFRGLRYLQNDGTIRSNTDFRKMHNGEDVIVVTSCRHPNHQNLRRNNATIDEECKRDEALHDAYNFADLMNTTFGLAPAGRQPSSYRFVEILSAGAVPVLIADNYVKPFDTLIQWHRCILQFPSTEMHRILKSVRAMKREEVERRQEYCLEVYNRWFAGDEALFEASIAAQKIRFMGAFPAWSGLP